MKVFLSTVLIVEVYPQKQSEGLSDQKALLNQSINQCKDRVKVYLVFINDEIKPQFLFWKWRAYIYKL